MRAVLLSLLFSTPFCFANVTVVDFDQFAHGEIIETSDLEAYGISHIYSTNYKGNSSNSDNNVLNRHVAFDSERNDTEDNDLEFYNNSNDYNDPNSPFRYQALNVEGYSASNTPGKILILQENGTGCSDGICNRPDDEGGRPGGYFDFRFTDVVSILSLDFFDVEDQFGSGDQFSKYHAIQFFDSSGVEIYVGQESIDFVDDGQFTRKFFQDIVGVQRLVVNLPGSGGIDNLVFRTTDVPEPATLALFGLALALLARRRQQHSL